MTRLPNRASVWVGASCRRGHPIHANQAGLLPSSMP
jgi:hypothetical protein